MTWKKRLVRLRMGKRWSCRVNWASCVSCEFLTGSRSQLSSWEYLGKRRFYNYSICLLPNCFSHSLMWHITILFSFFFVLNFEYTHGWHPGVVLRNAGYKERFSTADHITGPASLLDTWKPCGAYVVGFLRGNTRSEALRKRTRDRSVMWVWLQDNDGTKYNNSNLWMWYENYQGKNKKTRKRRPNVSYSVWTWNDHVIYSL